MSERIRIRDDRVVWREIEGRVLVLDLDGSRYFATNATGRVLWHALLEGATRAELTRRLIEAYDVSEEQAGRDVESFLGELSTRELLVSEAR